MFDSQRRSRERVHVLSQKQHGYGGKKEKIYLGKDIEHNYT